MATTTLPRGIRNANPGNIRHGDQWQGMAKKSEQKDSAFVTFTSPTWGIRALARTLISYKDKHGLNTVRGIIGRWAPPVENDTGAYVNQVAKAMGVGADRQIDVYQYEVMRPLVEAIIRHENGAGPLKTDNTWYDVPTIDKGLEMAGVVDKTKTVLATGEGKATAVTVGAASTAGAVTALAEFGPSIASHVQAANTATSGFPTWVRVAVMVLVLVAAGAGAYALYKKRQANKAVQ